MTRTACIITAAALLAVAVPGHAAAPALTASIEVLNGVNAYSLPTAKGRVIIYLPDDMRPGDTISGMVSVEPAGGDTASRQANSDTLNGYVIDVGGVRTPVSARMVRLVVGAVGVTGLELGLSDGRRVLARSSAAVGVGPSVPPSNGPPVIAQAGRPIPIQGAFDGDAANTRVSIAGQPAPVLAESPRQTIVGTPKAPVGPIPITVTEAGQTTTAAFRNLRIELAAPKTSLLKGEKTVLTVQVSGLEGMEVPVPLVLVGSPTIVLSGGNAQTLSLDAGSASPAGVFVTTRDVQAVAPGTFEITASVMLARPAPPRDALHPDALAMNGIDSTKDLLGLVSAMNDDARAGLLRATLKALRARLGDSHDAKTREWLGRKISIVEGAMKILGLSY